MRCSEPGHRIQVAIEASRGPGRGAWVVRPLHHHTMIRALTILLIATTTAFAADKMVKEEVSLTPTNKLTFEHPERFRYDVVQQPDDGFRTALRFRCFGADGIST